VARLTGLRPAQVRAYLVPTGSQQLQPVPLVD
jgi:hypothetical protein